MGRFINITTALTPVQRNIQDVIATSCSWVVPAGVTSATFEIWGGGGAGGPMCCCYCGNSTSGHGGGFSMKTVTTTPGDTYTVVAGSGGQTVYCAVGGANTGCRGCTSYVTGTGLSNFCAEGGYGGYWTCCSPMSSCCGGLAYGGDYNFMGGSGHGMQWSWVCTFSTGGASGLWGGFAPWHTFHCCPYMSCGTCGQFPGGGGSGLNKCCCDCCGCSGGGAPGMVRITY